MSTAESERIAPALDDQEPHQAGVRSLADYMAEACERTDVASPSTPGSAKPPVDPTMVTVRGCNSSVEDCARAMGGDDPASAYAAAMLWYQGYPDAPHPSGV